MKKSKKPTTKQAPKDSKQARKDALVDKLLSLDELKIVSGAIGTSRCCAAGPCD